MKLINQIIHNFVFIAAFFMLFMSLPVFSMAGTVDLPETGQTTCYDEDGNIISCTGTGQDGVSALLEGEKLWQLL